MAQEQRVGLGGEGLPPIYLLPGLDEDGVGVLVPQSVDAGDGLVSTVTPGLMGHTTLLVREPNRRNLEPLKLETPRIAPYLVLAQGRLTLHVVCLRLAHFRLPVPSPKSPCRADTLPHCPRSRTFTPVRPVESSAGRNADRPGSPAGRG
jgi:hypothetical protein